MHNTSTFDSRTLQGQVAVVTGASGGLGLAISEQLHAMGAQVVQADISYSAIADTAERMLAVPCDLANPNSIAALGQLVQSRFGRCDVLVNNAAISGTATPLEDFSVEMWDRVFNVNLRGALLCAQAVVPMMLAQQTGSIINVASISAYAPTRIGAYGSSKAGMLGLTQQMAVEWGPRGLSTNAVSPGMIRTPLSEKHYSDPTKLYKRTSQIPVRRLGAPQDIAGVVAFLATNAAAYVNGQNIVVDGGFLNAPLINLQTIDTAEGRIS